MSASAIESHEFMILESDLAEFLKLSRKELGALLKKLKIPRNLVGGRAFILPEHVHEVLKKSDVELPKQVISFQMLKGGVGKTTTAMNFAMRANMYGQRVLMIDLDQQANLSFAFGNDDPERAVWVNLLENEATIQDLIVEVTPTLHLIPSNLNNSVLERTLLNGKRNIAAAVRFPLAQIRDQYDTVILDTAPSLSAINTAVSCASDLVVLPVTPDKFSYVGLAKTLEDLDSIRSEFEAQFETKILFTRYDARETASRELLKSYYEKFGDQMLGSFIRTSSEVKNAVATGKTIYSLKSNAKTDYDLMTREVLQCPE